MHYVYGTDLKDTQSYIKLQIPAAHNVTKTPLGMSQKTQKLPLTQLKDKLLSVVYISFFCHKPSMRDRRGHSHLIAYLGISVSTSDLVNAMATLFLTLLRADTSDCLRGQLHALQCSVTLKLFKKLSLFLGYLLQHTVSLSNDKCSYITRARSRHIFNTDRRELITTRTMLDRFHWRYCCVNFFRIGLLVHKFTGL
jgi:hypothetical protein